MMTKYLWIQALKGCGFAQALREVSKTAVELGIADALAASTDPSMLQSADTSAAKQVAAQGEHDRPASKPVALPRPQLIAIAAKKDEDDEPDQPGVPPKRIRKPDRRKPDGSNGVPPGESPKEGGGS